MATGLWLGQDLGGPAIAGELVALHWCGRYIRDYATRESAQAPRRRRAGNEIGLQRVPAKARNLPSLRKANRRRTTPILDSSPALAPTPFLWIDKRPAPEQKKVTVAEIGLTHKDIHEARTIRDAEVNDPGRGKNDTLTYLSASMSAWMIV